VQALGFNYQNDANFPLSSEAGIYKFIIFNRIKFYLAVSCWTFQKKCVKFQLKMPNGCWENNKKLKGATFLLHPVGVIHKKTSARRGDGGVKPNADKSRQEGEGDQFWLIFSRRSLWMAPIGQVAVSWKLCEIGPKVLLIINRKLHTSFQMRWKSSTLDDLEGQYGNRNSTRSSASSLVTAGLSYWVMTSIMSLSCNVVHIYHSSRIRDLRY